MQARSTNYYGGTFLCRHGVVFCLQFDSRHIPRPSASSPYPSNRGYIIHSTGMLGSRDHIFGLGFIVVGLSLGLMKY